MELVDRGGDKIQDGAGGGPHRCTGSHRMDVEARTVEL